MVFGERWLFRVKAIPQPKYLKSASSYRAEMETYVGSAANIGSVASFEINTEISSKVGKMANNKEVIIQSKATCGVYKIAMDQIYPPTLSPSFLHCLNRTNASNITSTKKSVRLFGTHFVADILMGSRTGIEQLVRRTALESQEHAGVNIDGLD